MKFIIYQQGSVFRQCSYDKIIEFDFIVKCDLIMVIDDEIKEIKIIKDRYNYKLINKAEYMEHPIPPIPPIENTLIL